MALTSLVFLLAFFGALAMSFVRGPVWGLYAYLATFYLHPPSRWWGMHLPDLRWSLLAAFVTLLCVLIKKREDDRPAFWSHGLAKIFVLYVAWMWIQITFAVSGEHMIGVVLFTKYLILLYLIYEIVDTPERVRDFLLAHVVGCLYLGWLAYTAPPGGRLEGVGGPGINDSNTMSMHLGTGVVVAALLLMTERNWRFWVSVIAIPFMLNGMVQGGSRGAALGLLAGGLCLFRLKPPAFRKQFILFGALGAVSCGYLANDIFRERLASLRAVADDQAELDFSAHSRIVVFFAEWEMFFDHPLGAGHQGTAALSADYLSREYLTTNRADPNARPMRASHNTFMAVLVDQGIPGVILFGALLIWVWRSVRLTTKRSSFGTREWGYAAAIAAGLTVAIVAGQFANFMKAEVQMWLLALLASLRTTAVEKARVGAEAAPVTPPDVPVTANAVVKEAVRRPVLDAITRRKLLSGRQPRRAP